jgi:hypothetical protein
MPARYSPVGFSSAAGGASALRRAELPGCHLHFFRHVSKAAGTTVRFIFDKQVAMGEWEFAPMCHYGFREKDWKETLRRFRDAAVDPVNVQNGTGPRMLVEARNEWGASEAFEKVILPDLKKTRAELEALGCGVTTSLLFREPYAQYRSFWNYYIAKLRDDPDEFDPKKGPEAWGSTFEEWASLVPDLQLRELLGDRCTPRLREPVFDAETLEEEGDEEEGVAGIKKKSRVRLEKRRLPETCKVSLGDRARFESVVKQVDVLGTTDQFDLFLMQLADKTGIQHLEYSPSNEKKKSGVTTEFSVVDETAASERSELSVSFQEATVNDRWAYELVAATRDARVATRTGRERVRKKRAERRARRHRAVYARARKRLRRTPKPPASGRLRAVSPHSLRSCSRTPTRPARAALRSRRQRTGSGRTFTSRRRRARASAPSSPGSCSRTTRASNATAGVRSTSRRTTTVRRPFRATTF